MTAIDTAAERYNSFRSYAKDLSDLIYRGHLKANPDEELARAFWLLSQEFAGTLPWADGQRDFVVAIQEADDL